MIPYTERPTRKNDFDYLAPKAKGDHQRTGCRGHPPHTKGPHLKELWDFLEQPFQEHDPSRADERWRALTTRQVTLIDLEDLYARWQRLLPLKKETCPHVISVQLLSKLPWIKEKVVKQEAKNSRDSFVVDFSGLDPSLGRAPFEKEIRKYSAQRCTTVPEIVSHSGPRGDS